MFDLKFGIKVFLGLDISEGSVGIRTCINLQLEVTWSVLVIATK